MDSASANCTGGGGGARFPAWPRPWCVLRQALPTQREPRVPSAFCLRNRCLAPGRRGSLRCVLLESSVVSASLEVCEHLGFVFSPVWEARGSNELSPQNAAGACLRGGVTSVPTRHCGGRGGVPIGRPGPQARPTCPCPTDGGQFHTGVTGFPRKRRAWSMPLPPGLRWGGRWSVAWESGAVQLCQDTVRLPLLPPPHALTGRASLPGHPREHPEEQAALHRDPGWG